MKHQPFFHIFIIAVVACILSGTVQADDHGDTMDSATVVSGGMISGVLETGGDQDWFKFTVDQPGNTWIYTTGDTNTVGTLHNKDGRSIGYNNTSGAGDNFHISKILAPGDYYLRINGGSPIITGCYTLKIVQQSAAKPVGNKLESEALVDFGDVNLYKFTLQTPSRTWIYTTGDTNTVGTLHNKDGRSIGYNNTSGAGDNFEIGGVLAAGDYYLRISGASDTIKGGFDLHVLDFSQATPLSTTTSGEVETFGSKVLFRFSLANPSPTWIYTTGNTNTIGTLYNKDGRSVGYNNTSGAGDNFEIDDVLAAGDYYLLISGASDLIRGGFKAHLLESGNAIPIIRNGTWNYHIDPFGDIELFRFRSEGGLVSFTSSGAAATRAWILDESGRSKGYSSGLKGFRLVAELDPGNYLLVVRGESELTRGRFSLHAGLEVPTSPRKVKIRKKGKKVFLSWNHGKRTTQYLVQRKEGEFGRWADLKLLPKKKLRFVDKKTKPGVPYTYRVWGYAAGLAAVKSSREFGFSK